MTSQGSPTSRFQRALTTGNLLLVEAAARELPSIGLDDALRILTLLADARDPRFDRAAARWLGRLSSGQNRDLAPVEHQLAGEILYDRGPQVTTRIGESSWRRRTCLYWVSSHVVSP